MYELLENFGRQKIKFFGLQSSHTGRQMSVLKKSELNSTISNLLVYGMSLQLQLKDKRFLLAKALP